jgi:hypothetical protein
LQIILKTKREITRFPAKKLSGTWASLRDYVAGSAVFVVGVVCALRDSPDCWISQGT